MRRLLGILLTLLCLMLGCLAMALEGPAPVDEQEQAAPPAATTRPSKRPAPFRRVSREAELWRVVRAAGEVQAELPPPPALDPLEGIDLDALMAEAGIRGRVEDSEGLALSRVWVEAEPLNKPTGLQVYLLPGPRVGTFVDYDGTFQLEVPAVGEYMVTVRAPDQEGEVLAQRRLTASKDGPRHVVVVPPPTAGCGRVHMNPIDLLR